MKSKLTIIAGVVLLCLVATCVWFSRDAAETSETSLARVKLQHQMTTNHGSALCKPADKSASKAPPQSKTSPSKPKVSDEAITEMKHTATQTAAAFDAAVDDETGKRSRWYQQLKTWQQLLETAVQSGQREDLFALVPITAAFFARDREVELLAEPLDDLRHWMQHPAPFIIRELAKATAENGDQLDAETASIAIQVFSVRGFDNEPDWEDERKPIDSAGVLIARPEIMQSLESLPIDQLGFFLRAQTADTFFRRYEQNGDAMPMLRQRYSANREALYSSFNKLANKVAADQTRTQAK